MSYTRVHGVNLVGQISNFSIDSLVSDPTFTTPGHIWYNSTDSCYKGTIRDVENNLTIQKLVDDNILTNKLNAFDIKESVRVATTGTVTLAEFPTEIDGITLITGDRVLVKDANPATDNGIFIVGTIDTYAALTRSLDADNTPGSELQTNTYCVVTEGTTNASTAWRITNLGNITLGTTNIVWEQFTGLGDFIAGNGLAKDGRELSVVIDGNTLQLSANGLKVNESLLMHNLVDLTDVPAYGSPGTVLGVNAAGDALEYRDVYDRLIELSETPAAYGGIGQFLRINDTVDGLVFENNIAPIQAELDVTQTGLGINSDGTYTPPVGNTYLSSATSILSGFATLDTSLKALVDNYSSNVYTIETTNANTTHTITHNLGTQDLSLTVWVHNSSDDKFHLDIVDTVIVDNNTIQVNLGLNENVRVIVRSAEEITV